MVGHAAAEILLAAVLAPFVLALVAAPVVRFVPKRAGWILAVVPASIVAVLASHVPAISAGETVRVSYAWLPDLGVAASFNLDGLSLVFGLLISFIGALILVYAGGYLEGHRFLGRFYVSILLFMGSMLGVVLADNLVTLFVFWELTSLSSYLLIGFEHDKLEARKAALQALLVTGGGGLALLAGIVLLALVGGSFEISELVGSSAAIQAHGHYPAILVLVLLGAFTKSAQFPFHFWLPNAMAAPTPVSAYLHSATMVKAGIYLLARLTPVLGGNPSWFLFLTVFGTATMLVGAFLALEQTDLKRILAYSTVSALGTLTLMLGVGTTLAIQAAVVFLVVHSLYKGALFLVAGAIDHETGTREVGTLSGLRTRMPLTATAAVLAALSMAGVMPLFGFIGKELFLEALLGLPDVGLYIVAAAAFANILVVAVAIIIGIRPFFGPEKATPRPAHEAPASLFLGPVVLALLGLVFGLAPGLLSTTMVAPAVTAIRGEATIVDLHLWHGFTPALGISALIVAAGVGLYVIRLRLLKATHDLRSRFVRGPAEAGYDYALLGLNAVARFQTRALQSGYLRVYILLTLAVLLLLGGFTFATTGALRLPSSLPDVRFYEVAIAGLIIAAAITTTLATSRLAAVAALGTAGFGVALVYVLFGAPDLAMTQILIETFTVILFVFVFWHMPGFQVLTSAAARARDAVFAVAVGAFMTLLVLAATGTSLHESVSGFLSEASYPLAHGRNVVNVILVDFRGLDTLGEITVLAVAAIGIHALLKLRPSHFDDKPADDEAAGRGDATPGKPAARRVENDEEAGA